MKSIEVDNGHSPVGPSSIADIILCPGRVRMQKGIEDTTSFAAAQGTVAHKIGEDKLQGKRFPKKGSVITEDGHDIDVDNEMINAVKIYVDHINKIRSKVKGCCDEGIETSGNLAWLGLPEVFGTADYVLSQPFQTLYVRDYKHGAGVMVDAEGNPQLMTYALIAAQEMLETYERVSLGIVQPRGRGEHQVKVWETTPKELIEWAETVLTPTVKLALGPDASLTPGEKQCRFCRAQGICPALAKQSLQIAQADFKDFANIQPDEVVESVSIEKVIQVYEKLPLLKAFVKAVEGRVFNELSAGCDVPGYKLVSGRRSRTWTNEDAVAELLRAKKVEPYEYKILTPAKAEKALGKAKKEVQGLIQVSEGKPTIAPENDKRKAINTAQSDFENFKKD